MAPSTIRVDGLPQLISAFRKIDSGLAKEVNSELREAAKIVAEDARARFMSVSSTAAMGMRPRVRGGGRALVEQRRGRTTGNRPDFGALQMRRAFLPALASKSEEVVKRLEQMLDRLGGANGF